MVDRQQTTDNGQQTSVCNLEDVFVIFDTAKVIHEKSEVNKIIWMGKCLQKWILFRNFAQTDVIVRWASYSCSTIIIQLSEDHQSID